MTKPVPMTSAEQFVPIFRPMGGRVGGWRLSGIPLYLLAGLLVAIIGVADTWTGRELSFSILYAGPVALVAWSTSAIGAWVFAVLVAVVSLAADLAHMAERPLALAAWNMTVRLGFFIVITVGLTRIRELLQREHELASTDHLTGAANSRHFYQSLTRESARARRNGRSLTIGYLDLDHFKEINDRFGHLVGDQVLQTVAQVLRESIRINDVVARLGGDEFALLLPETPIKEAEVALRRIRTSLSERMGRSKWPIEVSIGAMTYEKQPDSIEEMIRRADDLMYRAKRQGSGVLLETYSPPA